MLINREALLDLVEWIEANPDRLASFENAVARLDKIGFRCSLTCELLEYPAGVTIHAVFPG